MNKRELLAHLKEKGFSGEILEAFRAVKREDFVPSGLRTQAHEDTALPLGIAGATISQPYTIAFMLSLLGISKGQCVLEIGSGSGYVLALLSELVGTQGRVHGVEIVPALAAHARERLKAKRTIEVITGNGFHGLPEQVSFERILVSAAAQEIPEHLIAQLKPGGVLVMPVGNTIVQVKKEGAALLTNTFQGFVFVPLRGA